MYFSRFKRMKVKLNPNKILTIHLNIFMKVTGGVILNLKRKWLTILKLNMSIINFSKNKI